MFCMEFNSEYIVSFIDDVTVTLLINIKYGDVAVKSIP